MKTKVESIHFENIEWVEIDKHRIWDNIFNKWDIIIHKFWEQELAIYNAYAPYKSVDMLEQFIHPEEDEQEADKFDMIMDTLSGVVHEYLEKNGLEHSKKKHQDDEDEDEKIFDDRYTIDTR